MFLLPSKTPRRRSRSTRCMMNSERQQSCWSRRLCFVSDKSAGAYHFPENPVVVIAGRCYRQSSQGSDGRRSSRDTGLVVGESPEIGLFTAAQKLWWVSKSG